MNVPEIPVTLAPVSTRARRQLEWIFAVALAARLLAMVFMVPDHLDPARNHWHFGWEVGMVAHSVATGHGFSSPFFADTGATAWVPPIYTYLLAGVFKLFGSFTLSSAITILGLNSLFSAATAVLVFYMGRRTFSERVGLWAGWIWALHPYAIYVAADHVWENSLTALILAAALLATLCFDQRRGLAAWIGLGLLWAVAVLTSPTVLALAPFLLLWTLYRLRRTGALQLLRVAVCVVAFFAGISPWLLRNYTAFHRFVPLRDNFWVEVRVGNTGDTSDLYPDWAHPSTGENEWYRYRTMGELGYINYERAEAIKFIRTYPAYFAWLSLRRFAFTWTGFWSLSQPYRGNEPFQIPNTFFCTALTVLMLLGFRIAWKERRESFWFYAAIVVPYPVVYYITHPDMTYRHAIDPEICVLMAVAAVSWWAKRSTHHAALEGDATVRHVPIH